jgi:hypothetical protein
VSLKTATLCLVLAGMGLFGVARSPGWVARSYARAFDDEVVSSRPALWPVLAADPALHALLVRETQPAYEDGGWAAAARRLDQLIFQQIIVHAGDSEIAACNKAWVGVKASLLARPAECRLFLDGGSDGFVAARVAQANEACLPALRDGARRRQEAPRRMMSAADYAAATALSLAQPDPLSASQRAALAGRFDDDRLSCAASLQRDRNLASLPDGVVAAYRRRDYALGSVAGAAGASAPVDGGPPADLVCPRAGTVLVLRVAGVTQTAPVRLRAIRQTGWDCLLQRAGGSQFLLWGSQDFGNPLRMLWPLEPRKQASFARGGGVVTYCVRMFTTYRLPMGWVRAYAIDETLREAGVIRYVLTRYWSPDLGVVVAQMLDVKSGGRPAGIGADWVLVAVE